MGKLTMYLTVSGFIIVMFYLMGLLPNTGIFISLLLNPAGLQQSSFYVQFYTILVAFTGVSAIALGLVFKNYDIVVAGLTLPIIIPVALDILGIIGLISTAVNPAIAILIFGVPLAILLFTFIEWVRNKD